MGATLAGCRAVAYESLDEISDDDAERALCLWVNTPANPSGELVDLEAAARWGRARRIPVFSDECYVEFTWQGPPRTILEHGTDGVVAVHSLSKRSNLAGVRVGFYAGDGDLVDYLRELRKHAGFMVAGPIQAAAIVAFGDDAHVDEQRARYLGRLQRLRDILRAGLDLDVVLPDGAFYLWVPAPGGDAWGLTKRLATDAGALVSPGEFYGPAGSGHVRIAVVQPDERIELIAQRLGRQRLAGPGAELRRRAGVAPCGGPLTNVGPQRLEHGGRGGAHLVGDRLHADDLRLDAMHGIDQLAEQCAQGLHLPADGVELAVHASFEPGHRGRGRCDECGAGTSTPPRPAAPDVRSEIADVAAHRLHACRAVRC